MDYTGERYIPENVTLMAIEHQHRYLWVKNFVVGKAVLDIACGEGYGTKILSEVAKSVCGCDISVETVEWAKNKYMGSNIDFRVMNIGNISFKDKLFDVITCFETIEHVRAEMASKAINDFAKILNNDGVLFISTPSVESSLHCENNQFHIGEMDFDEFYKKLSQVFKYVKIVSQSVYCSSVIGDGENAEIINFNNSTEYKYEPKSDKYLIAICTNAPPPDYKGSILIDRTQGSLKQLTRIRNFLSLPIMIYNFFIKVICYLVPFESWRNKLNMWKW